MEKAMAMDGQTPDVLGVGETQLRCVATSFGREVEIDPEGNEVLIDLKVFVRREEILSSELSVVDGYLFTTEAGTSGSQETPVPVSGREVTFRARTMLCVKAVESGPRSHFEFSLKDQAAT